MRRFPCMCLLCGALPGCLMPRFFDEDFCDAPGGLAEAPLAVDKAVPGLDASASAPSPPLGAIDTCDADVPGRPSADGTISAETAVGFATGPAVSPPMRRAVAPTASNAPSTIRRS